MKILSYSVMLTEKRAYAREGKYARSFQIFIVHILLKRLPLSH